MSNTYWFAPSALEEHAPEQEPMDDILIDMGDGQDYGEPGEEGFSTLDNGDMVIELGGGNPFAMQAPEDLPFDANLADYLSDTELQKIAGDICSGIEQDETSRSEWLENHAEGIKLLGMVLEQSGTAGDAGSTGLEGQHKTYHPLLLESSLLFVANAMSALLPASGPAKIRDDHTVKPEEPPMPPMMGHNGGPPLDDMPSPEEAQMPPQGFMYGGEIGTPHPAWGMAQGGTPPTQPFAAQMPNGGGQPININLSGAQPQQPSDPNDPQGGNKAAQTPGMSPAPPVPQAPQEPDRDLLAEAFEKDFNHYLTTTAKEYYPDTRRMLFSVGFGGLGIKKVYNCPLRRRPVAESVPIENFIVSNAFSDLSSMPRITHKIAMRPAVLRRMQLLKSYRDVEMGDPIGDGTASPVKQIQSDVMGVNLPQQTGDPADRDYDICETYCELELDQFAPEQFKEKGLPLPYKVTLEKNTQTILEIRRNWKQEDDQCLAKEYFVEYVYVQGFGFYPIGLVHILGNTTKTLTAAWRELIDSGMFANFPGFIYAKGAGRQLTNQFRVPPGGGIGLDVGLKSIQEAAMPMPYKDITPTFTQFIQQVQEYGQRLGGASNIEVGEGRADAPVGTTLALIEQATKPLGSVLKGLHSSQSKELQLLKERFKEDPQALRRFNKKPAMDWQDDQIIQALEDYDLVPVSDPNNPTHMHRIAKANSLYSIMSADPQFFDKKKGYKKVFAMAELGSPDDLFAPPPQPGSEQGDPFAQAAMADVKVKAMGQMQKAQTENQKITAQMQDRREERASNERIEQMKLRQSTLNLASTMAIHSSDAEAKAAERAFELAGDHRRANVDISKHAISVAANVHGQHQQRQHDAAQGQMDRTHAANVEGIRGISKVAQERIKASNKPTNGRA